MNGKYISRVKALKCVAPAWPNKNASPEELRNRPANDPIASNTLTSLKDHFASIIKALPAKPILIGHSLGGLIVQLLLQTGIGNCRRSYSFISTPGVKQILAFIFESDLGSYGAIYFEQANLSYVVQ
jgi:pimeloyl-ACP methyl ester carboxylesterase